MKQIYKNIEVPAIVARMTALTELQSAMTLACMRNNLYLKSTINSDASSSAFSYEIFLDRHCELPFIAGSCDSRDPLDLIPPEHYIAAMDMIEGRIVSVAMPPAGEGLPAEVKPMYWKRQLIHTANASDFTQPVGDGKTMAVWSGFNNVHAEIMRIPEGTQNPGHEKVRIVKYQHLGDKGVIVNVVLAGQEPPVRKEASLPTAGTGPTSYPQAMSSAASAMTSAVVLGVGPSHDDTKQLRVATQKVRSVDEKVRPHNLLGEVKNKTTMYFFSECDFVEVKVTCGFDRPMGGFFMTIEPMAFSPRTNEESGLIYSNLDDKSLSTHRVTQDVERYISVLRSMKIPFMVEFFDKVLALND